jgi:hypothetical protein
LIHVAFIQVFRNEGENFWRNPVYGREAVPHGPNQAKDLQRIPFEDADLSQHKTCKANVLASTELGFFSLHLNLVHGRRNPAKSRF